MKSKYEIQNIMSEYIEKQIKDRFKNIINPEAVNLGADHASELLPRLQDILKPYIGAIRGKCKDLGMEVRTYLQAGNEEYLDQADEANTLRQVKIKEEKRMETIHKRKGRITMHSSIIESWNPNTGKLALGVLAGLGITEWLVDASSLQNLLGLNLITSYFLGAGIAISVFITSHNTRNILELGKTALQKACIYLSITGFFTLIFYFLASFREAESTGGLTSVVGFVSINLLLFFAASLTAYFLLPTKDELAKSKRKKELSIEILNFGALVTQYDNEIEGLKNGLDERKVARAENKRYYTFLMEWIEEQYQSAVAMYIASNLANRGDGTSTAYENEVPVLFNNEIKLLTEKK